MKSTPQRVMREGSRTVTRQDHQEVDPPLVMIVDNDPSILATATSALQAAGYRTVSADTNGLALSIAGKFVPQVALLHLDASLMNSLSLCRELRAHPDSCDLPVIFMSDVRLSHEQVTTCLDAGAHDFLTKPIELPELLTRVHVALRERMLRDAYRRLALEDPMTRLFNRRQSMHEISSAMDLARQQGIESHLLLCDIDQMNDLNKRFGYDLGDEVIVTFSRLIRRLSSMDVKVGRIGGEEFVVVMVRTTAETALNTARSLQRTFSSIVFDPQSDPKHFTVSIGLTTYRGEPAEMDVDQFLTQADHALAVAKTRERDRVVAFDQLDPASLPELRPPQRHARLGERQRQDRASVAPKPLVPPSASRKEP
jgi:diguanylate cyclase (GGDEF)-like protein